MKKFLLLFILVSILNQMNAQNFISKWDMSYPGSYPDSIKFKVATSGNVNYTWQTIPAGTSGSGSFNGSMASIGGFPTGSIIQLNINPTNLQFINMGASSDGWRLIDIMQWGSAAWTSMDSAFYGCHNLTISVTDLPNLNLVTDMSHMFEFCNQLNGPANINSWNTSNITNMSHLFDGAISFNQSINNWNTSNVTDMSHMFEQNFSFNQPLNNWNTGNVIDMGFMFSGANIFNQPLNNWNTSNVQNMIGMFEADTLFNQPIGAWNTSNVTNMGGMFSEAYAFNQPIGNWNTGNVTSMNTMFLGAKVFNQPIGNWNTSNVNDMWRMFEDAIVFNQPIDSWNMSNVMVTMGMFKGANMFNQPIGNWNVSNVMYMDSMFKNAISFNRSLANWNLNANVAFTQLFNNSGLDCINYSSTLIGWRNNPNCPSNRNLGALNMHYGTNAVNSRNYLMSSKGWTINGDNLSSVPCCVTQNVVLNATSCDVYTFNGQILNMSGVYKDTLLGSNGCDSIITLNLTINSTSSTITQSGTLLTSNVSSANYQWLYCPSFTPILGATSQTYTATTNGGYACAVYAQNGCSDTSTCVTVSNVGINSIEFQHSMVIEPNPVSSTLQLTSSLFRNLKQHSIKIYDELGRLVIYGNYEIMDATMKIDISKISKGVYFIQIETNKGVVPKKFIKE